MKSYTHIVGAILTFILFSYIISLNSILIGIFFAGWISIFPDILDKLIGKHRGYGHSIIWIIPFILVGLWNIGIAAALIIGFLSHIFLDTLTENGSPVLYPFSKTNFVCFSKGRRIKTGTNQDKAVFLFILFLLVPLFLFTTGIGSLINSDDQNFVFGAGDNTNNAKNNDTIKNNFNFNFELSGSVKKNITLKKINENETEILITDIK